MYLPAEGDALTVMLPNEAIRATVIRVISRNMIEAELNLAEPFTRIHGYGFGQTYKFKRQSHLLGEQWKVSEPALKRVEPKGPKPRIASPDVVPEPPVKQRPVQKAKRRSDTETEKARVKK